MLSTEKTFRVTATFLAALSFTLSFTLSFIGCCPSLPLQTTDTTTTLRERNVVVTPPPLDTTFTLPENSILDDGSFSYRWSSPLSQPPDGTSGEIRYDRPSRKLDVYVRSKPDTIRVVDTVRTTVSVTTKVQEYPLLSKLGLVAIGIAIGVIIIILLFLFVRVY